MTTNEAKAVCLGLIFSGFGILIYLSHHIDDLRNAIGLTVLYWIVTIIAVYKYFDRRNMRRLRNRYRSFHVVGCAPSDIPHIGVRKGDPPQMKDFAERCIFVPHKDVRTEAAKISAQLERANKGVPVHERHPVKIYTYSFQAPINEAASVERWFHQEDVANDNSYPRRIMNGVEADIRKTETAQYKAGIDGYRKVVMGQSKPQDLPANVIEW